MTLSITILFYIHVLIGQLLLALGLAIQLPWLRYELFIASLGFQYITFAIYLRLEKKDY